MVSRKDMDLGTYPADIQMHGRIITEIRRLIITAQMSMQGPMRDGDQTLALHLGQNPIRRFRPQSPRRLSVCSNFRNLRECLH